MGREEVFRKCRICGLEAHNEEQLERFCKQKSSKYGRQNICKNCWSEWKKRYRSRDPQQQKYLKEYHKKPEVKKRNLNHRRARRIRVLERLGGKCVKCGFSDFRALQIDHIHGGGTKEIRGKGPWQYLKYLLDLPIEELKKNYQCLCANCNWIKKWENNENPRQEV